MTRRQATESGARPAAVCVRGLHADYGNRQVRWRGARHGRPRTGIRLLAVTSHTSRNPSGESGYETTWGRAYPDISVIAEAAVLAIPASRQNR